MSTYCTEVDIENYLLTNIDPSFSTQITAWIEAVSAHIEKYTGRIFVADSVASARLFEGKSSNKLLIDECVAVTVVEQGDTYGENFTTVSSGDYQLLPYNEIPKTAIGLKRTVWGLGVHRITAKWGYSVAVPADIKFAATVLASGIVWAQVYPNGSKKSEQIGNYEVSFKDEKGDADYDRAMAILDSYRRINL
ncbi:MAG: hypothetical protein E6Q97_32160 [Desulfurellales bacterium]|nr:MAG: hypothetical protein E6Q97_32160 [Desulfurellales bacterium]